MAKGISLLLTAKGTTTDITPLVARVVWKGRKGSAARSITATIIDDDGYKHARAKIPVGEGCTCIFSYNGSELFRGMIMQTKQGNDKQLQFTAYDNGIYLSNNSDTFVYSNATADSVFLDICRRFNLPHDRVAACSYKIPELTKSSTTAWDALSDALSNEFNATGTRHYVSSSHGKLSLLTRKENILQWVIESGGNLVNYSFTDSIEKVKTRLKMVSRENTVAASAAKSDLEEKIGIFQKVEKADESFNEAQLREMCSSMLDEASERSRSLSITAAGIPEVISGMGVFIIIPHLGLSRTFYVDEDQHTFDRENHTMSLKLNYAADIPRKHLAMAENSSKSSGGNRYFRGGAYYVSSTSTTPINASANAGSVKLIATDVGALHPYYVQHTDNTTTVYGWVDAETLG